MYRGISFLGIFGLMFLAWIFSTNRKNINWRAVFWGTALQLFFALFVFYIPIGLLIFRWINGAVVKILAFANEGMYFVFGPLAVPPGSTVAGVFITAASNQIIKF